MRGRDWSLENRTCLVTGATSGIGQETALGPRARGSARADRRPRSACAPRGARAEIARRSGNRASSCCSPTCRRCARSASSPTRCCARCDALHVLVNNAGVVNRRHQLTRRRLRGHLRGQSPRLLRADRCCSTASRERARAHRQRGVRRAPVRQHRLGRPALGAALPRSARGVGDARLRDLEARRTSCSRASWRADSRAAASPRTALHPGAVSTRLGTNNGVRRPGRPALLRPFMRSPAEGAKTSIHLASSPELAEVSGALLREHARGALLARGARRRRGATAVGGLAPSSAGIAGAAAERGGDALGGDHARAAHRGRGALLAPTTRIPPPTSGSSSTPSASPTRAARPASSSRGTGSSATPPAGSRRCAARAWSASSRCSSPARASSTRPGVRSTRPSARWRAPTRWSPRGGARFDAEIARFELREPGAIH